MRFCVCGKSVSGNEKSAVVRAAPVQLRRLLHLLRMLFGGYRYHGCGDGETAWLKYPLEHRSQQMSEYEVGRDLQVLRSCIERLWMRSCRRQLSQSHRR